MPFSVMILDDEPAMCDSLSRLLSAHGYSVRAAQDPKSALERIKAAPPDLLITDLKMPGLSGISVLRSLHDLRVDVPTIMISGYATVENVVEAMQYGARNFYEKPVKISKLLEEIGRYAAGGSEAPRGQTSGPGSLSAMAKLRENSRNTRMLECIEVIRRAASTDVPVVITGESGTGKELFAEAIHEESRRRSGPFVKINCASIPESLLESELFGHEKGAFTDAREARAGKFEAAEGGTIFFDEIGEMNQKMQAKLLRALQEMEYERVGSNQTRRMNVRFIAATNQNLPELITSGEFREDLYYRLAVVHVSVPPLRDRGEDSLLIAATVLREMNAKYGKGVKELSPEVRAFFQSHRWPGNVRELRNCLERAVIFCDGPTLPIDCLPEQYRGETIPSEVCRDGAGEGLLKDVFQGACKELILETLAKTGGSRQRSAELLGINRRTLYNKMKKLGLE